MPLSSAQVSVGTSATSLNTVDEEAWIRVLVHNAGSADVFLGDGGVTTTTGLALGAGDTENVDLGPGDELHGIVASGSETVHVLRTVE